MHSSKLFLSLIAGAVLSTGLNAQTTGSPPSSSAGKPVALEQSVVTASGIDELISDVPQTIQSFSVEQLNIEKPRSAVDFFSENAIGFVAPIAPGHSFLSLRGAITNQIGYDDSSEVAVIINGRRAGTDNLSKLSTFDTYSVEVLRGPSSVIYGSSAIGGVVNLITKNGLNSPGSRVIASAGSWDHYTTSIESGGKSGKWDYYVGGQYQSSGDYNVGKNAPGDGTLVNTSYTRRTANVTLGYALNTLNHVELVLRSDGLYDVGHRGVTYSYTDHDDRYNNSAELKFEGSSADAKVTWTSQTDYVRDVEVWHWSQDPLLAPFSNAAAGDRAGIARDDNTRNNYVVGEKLSSTYAVSATNTLLAGLDLESTRLRSHRERAGTAGYVEGWQPFPTTQPTVKTSPVNIAPLQYNYDSEVVAPYFEDTQKLVDDRLNLKAGARFDKRWQGLKHTQYEVPPIDTSTRTFDAVTYRVGATFKTTDWLTLKANAGTGFRAPNPVELNGYSFSGNGVLSVGNPNLKNEESFGWELGSTISRDGFLADVTYFNSDIRNRITGFVSGPATLINGYTTSVSANLAHARTDGVEFKFSYDFASLFGLRDYRIEPFVAGTYNFNFEIDDPVYNAANNDKHIVRVNRYQDTFGLKVARKDSWDVSVSAILAGPTYESGATHGLINADYPTNPATGQPITTWIFRKDPYWLVNFRAGYEITSGLRVFGGINNLLNLNYDPSFLALYKTDAQYRVNPYKSQSRGTYGSSAPGRELYAGLEYKF